MPPLSHNSAAILLKKRQKPAQKRVSNILRKNFKQLLKVLSYDNKNLFEENRDFPVRGDPWLPVVRVLLGTRGGAAPVPRERGVFLDACLEAV